MIDYSCDIYAYLLYCMDVMHVLCFNIFDAMQ